MTQDRNGDASARKPAEGRRAARRSRAKGHQKGARSEAKPSEAVVAAGSARSRTHKPLPPSEGLAGEFFAHCRQRRLCFQRCTECRSWRHLPRLRCARCGSTDWEWQESSGRGRVFTWTVTHRALHPAFASQAPYAVVVVELEEGVRMVSGIRDLLPGDLALDLPVEVVFEPVGDDVVMPFFRPREVS